MSEKKEQKKSTKKENPKKVVNNNTKKKLKVIGMLILLIAIIVIGIKVIIDINANKNQNGDKTGMNQTGTEHMAEENVSIAEDGTKVNISEKIKEEKELDGLKITDMEITEVDNVSTIIAKVKNDTEEEKGEYAVEIILLDNKGKEITTISGYIGKIKAGGSMSLSASATYDFVNAYDYKINKK